MLKKAGVEVLDFGIIEDKEESIRKAFLEADSQADVVISSGGVSVGDADYTKTVLEQIGKIEFWKVAIKPGKPFAFGTLPDSYFLRLARQSRFSHGDLSSIGAGLPQKAIRSGVEAQGALPCLYDDTDTQVCRQNGVSTGCCQH